MSMWQPVRGPFPATRMRRLRRYAWSRSMVEEHRLDVAHLIWPIFLIEGQGHREPIGAMPGVERISIDLAVEAAVEAVQLGIPAMALFPKTPLHLKSELAEESCNQNNLVCRALRAIRDRVGDSLGLLADVALDPYTSHGQDGLMVDGQIVNDPTIEVLCRQAIVQAEAGATVLAPSDMMDGRIGAIRQALDESGFSDALIMSYAAKYASAFYGPFREAVGSASALGKGDKKTYQMNPANRQEALHEAALDLEEGADWVMVKPGMPYLDIVSQLAQTLQVPVAAYQVSGEYSMLQGAIDHGWLAEQSAILESLLCFRRAGASSILTYFAPRVARWLNG